MTRSATAATALVVLALPGCGGSQGGPMPAKGATAFLALGPNGAITARADDGTTVSILAGGPYRESVFDPVLGLVWLRREDRIEVLDLQASNAEPHPIATGIAVEASWSVSRPLGDGRDILEVPSVCEHEHEVMLEWGERAKLTEVGATEGAPAAGVLVGAKWLTHTQRKPRRESAPRFDFVAPDLPRVKLPTAVAGCDDPDDCGRYVGFGLKGLRLVMVQSHEGEDCHHYGCLVEDPATGLYATPPELSRWQEADQVEPGPCGLYRFDSTGTRYLVDELHCVIGGGCQPLDGAGLGWVNPGPTVGTDG